MATKTFKTRIKLKYDSASNWLPNGAKFQGLAGELLIGSDDNYLRIGTGDIRGWEFAKMSADNVNITSYTSGNTEIDTAQAAIADLNERINTINTNGVVTSFGGKKGDITLNPTSGLSINDNNVLTIAKASVSQLGVVKVTAGNGLAINDGVISMAAATANNAGAVKVNATNGLSLSDGTISMGLANGTTAGAMSSSDFTKLGGIAEGAQVNVIELVKVNDSDLAITGKSVNITIEEGSENGTISVNGTDVAVTGLKSAAYTEASAYATAAQGGKADTALQSITATGDGEFVTTTVSDKGNGTTQNVSVSVTTHEIASADETVENGNGLATAADVKSYVESQLTGIVGAMVYKGTVSSNNNLPTTSTEGVQAGWTYVVSAAGTYNGQSCEVGDMIIVQSVGNDAITFNIVNGENQVSSANATITAGATNATKVATVDGTDINVKVEVTGGTADIATVNGDVVTLKAGVKQGDGTGTIDNSTDSDIVLAKVAKTGAAVDVSYTPGENGVTNKVNLQEAVGEISSHVKNNENNITTISAAIETLNGDGEGSVTNTVNTAIGALDGSATIATEADGVVTLKAGITETDGIVDNSTDSDIVLAKVATTGSTDDLTQGLTLLFDCGNATEVVDTES